MKKKTYTTTELFRTVNNRLKEKDMLPDILDYSLPESYPVQVMTDDWSCIGRVNFGNCEGIYLDMYLEGCVKGFGSKFENVHIGTFKTLDDDKEAYKTMACLMAEFVFELQELVFEEPDSFINEGFSYKFFRPGSEKPSVAVFYMERDEREQALLKRQSKLYDRVLIVDNITGEEELVELREQTDVKYQRDLAAHLQISMKDYRED